jgi:methylated-DNA-[protein]-cysteine S-methyltransferase
MAGTFVCRLVSTHRGWCAVVSRGQGIWRCCLPQETPAAALAQVGLALPGDDDPADPALGAAARYLQQMFRGEPPTVQVPLDLADLAPFTRAVLAACSQVPYGATVTYGDLAARAGRPGAARAVGQAMARNPLAPLVPCHRVVGVGGKLTGFGGGLELKATLLAWERAGRPAAEH